MPKEERVPYSARPSPYSRRSNKAKQQQSKNPSRSVDNTKEWEEVRCPICMEHPHNAVLLNCSSDGKGCKPYICNTSQHLSNCLDQFRKSSKSSLKTQLVCPLCRGQISGWVVVEPARRFMNSKSRSCSCEGCDFVGTYPELRKHARSEHPSARPSEANPERQEDWRRLEEERDYGDFVSTLRNEHEHEIWQNNVYDELMNAVSEADGNHWFERHETLGYIHSHVLPMVGFANDLSRHRQNQRQPQSGGFGDIQHRTWRASRTRSDYRGPPARTSGTNHVPRRNHRLERTPGVRDNMRSERVTMQSNNMPSVRRILQLRFMFSEN